MGLLFGGGLAIAFIELLRCAKVQQHEFITGLICLDRGASRNNREGGRFGK